MTNRVDPDQTAPKGAVCSGSTLFASILNLSVMLGNYLQETTSTDVIFQMHFFLGALRAKPNVQIRSVFYEGLLFDLFIFSFQGCYDELVHYIQDHAIVIGISSIAAVVLMVSRILSLNRLVKSMYCFSIYHNLQLDATGSYKASTKSRLFL